MAEPTTTWGREAVSDIRAVQTSVSGLEQRVESFERKVDERFDKVDARFDKVDARFESLERKADARFESFGREVDARFDKVNTRFESLDGKVATLAGDFRELRGEVRLFMSVVAGTVVVFGVAFLATGAWLARSVIELQVRSERPAAVDRGPVEPPPSRE